MGAGGLQGMCDCACVLLCDASHGRLRSLVVQSSWHYGDDAGGAEADCILQETPDEGAGISVVHVVQGVALCQLQGRLCLPPIISAKSVALTF